MHRLIACVIGGWLRQPFGGHPMTAHSLSTDLSQIYVAAFWVGTVELVIVATIGLGLWLWARCGRARFKFWSGSVRLYFASSANPLTISV